MLDSPEINAFALPGGYVYVTRGIMAFLDSEAELAGVMGHEIGHVAARHGAQRATRRQSAGIGVIAATVLGAVLEVGGLSGATNIASQLSQGAAAGYVASYSRDQESQADELGAEYLARNHYDPRNMIDVIQALKSQEQFAVDNAKAEGKPAPSGSNWLSSHPANDKRLADIKTFATNFQAQDGYGDDGRARYLQAIAGMTFGDSAEQGLVRGRDFYHPGLGIALTAPPGWQIQNSPEAIAVVNGEGDAGLIVRQVPPKNGSTHDEVIRNVSSRSTAAPKSAASMAWPRPISAGRLERPGTDPTDHADARHRAGGAHVLDAIRGQGRSGTPARQRRVDRDRVVVSRHDRGRPRCGQTVERADGALPARRVRRAGEIVAPCRPRGRRRNCG